MWSPELEAIHGLAPGSFRGTIEAFRDEIHPDDRAYVEEAIHATVARQQEHQVEYRVIRPDGSIRWVEGRGQLFVDREERPERIVGICTDVTARKQVEERFRLALEAAPTAVVMVDPSGTIVLANALTEEIFGYARNELVGRPIESLVPTRFRGRHAEHRDTFSHDPAQRPMGAGRDLFALRKDGSEVAVEIGLSPVELPEGPHVLAAITDISERIRLQKAERAARQEAEAARSLAETANRARADFLARISHDLRTPLNAIGGYAQILEMHVHGRLSEAQQDAVVRIEQNKERLVNLLNQLLSFARVEAGRISYHIEDTRLDPVIASLDVVIAPQAREQGVTFSYTGAGDLAVRADREKLEQVLINLLTNAVKFTDPGGRVTLEAECRDQRVAIHVCDTGGGIAPDHLASIFEPFVQAAREPPHEDAGVGLGLAISRELARGMGGDVTAVSSVGQGSTFTLWLPRAVPAETA